MSHPEKKENGTLSLMEAVETLSHIADWEFDRNTAITNKDMALDERLTGFQNVYRMDEQYAGQEVQAVKEIFKTILDHLKAFYKKEYGYVYDPHALNGIKTIMVLVGEAAKKLDKFTTLFNSAHSESVTQSKEYKKLQDFYINRIERKIDEGLLGKWVLGLSGKLNETKAAEPPIALIGKREGLANHIFIDLESVKKDTEYELFFLRKEDGSRFFNPGLIRNIQLVSNFGEYFGEEVPTEALIDTNVWYDRLAHHSAKHILAAVHIYIQKFYQEACNSRDDLVEMVNKTLMALMLAANTHNLWHETSAKCCQDYFHDFQQYLRRTLNTREYQRLIAYPPEESNKLHFCLVDLVQSLCLSIYTQLDGFHDLVPLVHAIVQAAHTSPAEAPVNKMWWNGLNNDYKAMSKLLKTHPNGPVNKILTSLESGACKEFDPFVQDNLPQRLFNGYIKERNFLFIRLPSPIHQEFVHKAAITKEFKEFLRALTARNDGSKCLVFNFQDRVSWKEHARSAAIEELARSETFSSSFEVATIAKDTEFYHQIAPYNDDNAAHFIEQFKAQLKDDNGGFIFPASMSEVLKGEFVNGIMKTIHRVFFKESKELKKEQRLDFISLFYLLIELKMIEMSSANVIGFSCKDCIDIGGAAAAELFVFMKFFTQERLSENDQEHLDAMLYGPSLLHRERLMHVERFQRILGLCKCIESVAMHYGHSTYVKIIREAFGRYFKMPIFEAKAFFLRNISDADVDSVA